MSDHNFIPFVASTETKNDVTKTMFLNIQQYMVYCYDKLFSDNVKYSKKTCKESTSLKFEDYLKFQFIDNYLNQPANKRECNIYDILTITFQAEVEKLYAIDNYTQTDKIDIFVSNLNLDYFGQDTAQEDIYFAFECKRLANNSKNNDYINDIVKFVEREYKFRLPYNGMIGFVEKYNNSIEAIISDIEHRLQKHSSIKSISFNDSILQIDQAKNDSYSRYSVHKHNTQKLQIEIGHLFFDYSKIVI